MVVVVVVVVVVVLVLVVVVVVVVLVLVVVVLLLLLEVESVALDWGLAGRRLRACTHVQQDSGRPRISCRLPRPLGVVPRSRVWPSVPGPCWRTWPPPSPPPMAGAETGSGPRCMPFPVGPLLFTLQQRVPPQPAQTSDMAACKPLN